MKSFAVLAHAGSKNGAYMFTMFTLLDSNYQLYFTQTKLPVSCLSQLASKTVSIVVKGGSCNYSKKTNKNKTVQQLYSHELET